MVWIKFDEEINVAVWAKILPQCRAEDGQLADVVALTEMSKGFFGKVYLHGVTKSSRL